MSLGTFEFGDPPESVAQNVAEMQGVMAARRAANLKTAIERDTERYLVVVFRDRAAREAALRALGLPEDERYLLAEALELALRPEVLPAAARVLTERDCRVADIAHSGSAG